MEDKVRELERILASSPFDFDARRHLTQWFLRAERGQFVVWRGELSERAQSKCAIAQFQHPISVAAEVSEPAYLLAITGLSDLANLLILNPDGLFNLPSQTYTPLHQGNTAGAKKLASLQFTSDVEVKRATPVAADPNNPNTRRIRFPEYEVIEQPLYDREIIEAGSHTSGYISYFATALGSQKETSPVNFPFLGRSGGHLRHKTFTKHQTDTNMDQRSSLPYPKNFAITGFSLFPQKTANIEEYKKVIDNSWFRFFIGTMDYLVVPAATVAGTAGAHADFTFRVSAPSAAHYQLPSAFDLIPQQNFRAELVLNTKDLPGGKLVLTEPLSIMCVLWGHFTRGPIHESCQ